MRVDPDLMERADVLVVDDDPNALDIVRTFLEAKGYTVATAKDGGEALLEVRRRKRLVKLGHEPVDDRPRRACRRKHAVPDRHDEIVDAGFF